MGDIGGKVSKGRLVIIGGGGHAGVVLDAFQSSAHKEFLSTAAILDSKKKLQAQGAAHGLPVIGGDEVLSDAVANGFHWFVLGLGGGIDNQQREKLFAQAISAGLSPLTVIHDSAVVSPSAKLGEGTVVLPRAVINANSCLGDNVIVNTAAVVEHDCRVGDHVHIAPRACLLGGVTVGRLAFVGAGAIIRQGLALGDRAVVGCGAVVVEDVPSGAVVYGNPAKQRHL